LAGNETLGKSLGHVFERIVLKRRTDGLYDAARGVNAHQQHLRLLRAMQERNVNEAVSIVRAHIRKGKQNVLSDLEQRLAIRERATATVEQRENQTYRKEEKWPQI
jgi:DNA-binding GntR family transcriptional regulator